MVTDATFEQEVLKSDIPVLVDFWAPWCGPCRMIAPLIDQLAEEYAGKLKAVRTSNRLPGLHKPRTAPGFSARAIGSGYVFATHALSTSAHRGSGATQTEGHAPLHDLDKSFARKPDHEGRESFFPFLFAHQFADLTVHPPTIPSIPHRSS